jgi:GTP:adenosylcobinamide-phosphate guanylyltransferase
MGQAPSTVLPSDAGVRLDAAITPDPGKVLNPEAARRYGGIQKERPVLVMLAAGRGTRFGSAPKCIQTVGGTPLARLTIDAFRRFRAAPVICLVGHQFEAVTAALGTDLVYVRSADPAGGTAYAAYEAFSVPALQERDPLLVITMGDRVVTPSVFRRLLELHTAGNQEAELTLLTATYPPPRNRGKGRVRRDARGRVLGIVEQNDIEVMADARARTDLEALTEGNCPLYVIRAGLLHRALRDLTNANAQQQFYLTDIVAALSRAGGEVRSVTLTAADAEYELLTGEVTRPADLTALAELLARSGSLLFRDEPDVEEAALAITDGRPPAQVAAIARQLERLSAAMETETQGWRPEQPVALGVAGGRFRLAFMHPDMARFFGPAWQMPIGAGTPEGEEQIVLLAQAASDHQIHLYPTNPKYRERVSTIASDGPEMYPDETIVGVHAYEAFGTRLSERLLITLGYLSDDELERRRAGGQPLPDASLWVANNLRRPFPLVANALASLRTLRHGAEGVRVGSRLGARAFGGLRLACTGDLPAGGFASSSALIMATSNALNALFDFGLAPDRLVDVAAQAEYGTGVRAGSLDQATIQMGLAGQGVLISSNPGDKYRVLGTWPVSRDRFCVFFANSVERDRAAWRWSWGAYAPAPGLGRPTSGEMRKLTGKSAEIAALLAQLPLNQDWFKFIEADLVSDGVLGPESRVWISQTLRQIPLRVQQGELQELLRARLSWYQQQLIDFAGFDRATAVAQAAATMASLLAGWRNPVLRRTGPTGVVVEESGVPLRAMLAYLFAEVARNFQLIHQPDQWIEWVSWSQRGDRAVDIDPRGLPPGDTMAGTLAWEVGTEGPTRLERWLEHLGATPFDYQRGLDDASLAQGPPELTRIEGGSFFRGLALIDLAEAMLKRVFGQDAVAVRVNAAGQGDYFQVHVDTRQAEPQAVQSFLRAAFYRRFGLSPEAQFVEPHPGGGAVGVRLLRAERLNHLAQRLRLRFDRSPGICAAGH